MAMKRIRLKFNYGSDYRVFDATLSVVDQMQGTGFVIALGQLELERYIFLAPGSYIAKAIYDLPGAEGTDKKTCLFEHQFESEEIERLSIDFKKPTSILSGFSQPDLRDLEEILKTTVGGRINPRSDQTFAINTVKELEDGNSLEERVVIDKNGKVEYEFSFHEPDLSDALSEAKALASQEISDEVSTESTVRFISTPLPSVDEHPSPRPYTVHALNYGFWNIGLYGLNSNIGAPRQGYRDIRSIAYLRPRSELFNRLPAFIAENMTIARRINGLPEN